jgi:hypothetical protein
MTSTVERGKGKVTPLPHASMRAPHHTGSQVIQRHLAVGAYAQVYDNGGTWYGQIVTVDEEGKQYGVRVGGTENIVPVPFHKAGLHSAFVANGLVPQEFKTKPLDISQQVWCYHVTAASNLPSILAKGGLVPRGTGQHNGAFAGLDPARGATEVGGVPERLETTFKLLETVPQSYQDSFKRKLHDTMLGSKEDFVYATRMPERIFNYADEIRKKGGVSEIIVFRFRAGRRAWYKDEEDDTAEKSLSSIPLDQLQAAKFQRREEDVSREVAQSYLQSIPWYSLTDDLERRFLLLWAT